MTKHKVSPYSLLVLLVLCAMSFTSRVVEAAEFSSPTYGGNGGTAYNLDCGADAVLVGIEGKVGEWIDSIIAICRKVDANGNLGDTFTKGPTGGNGGSVQSQPCQTGLVAKGIFAHPVAFGFVQDILIECDTWDPKTRKVAVRGGAPGSSVLKPKGFNLSTLLSDYKSSGTRCPDGKPAKALRGKSATYVDSVRLICDDVVLPAGASASAAAPGGKPLPGSAAPSTSPSVGSKSPGTPSSEIAPGPGAPVSPGQPRVPPASSATGPGGAGTRQLPPPPPGQIAGPNIKVPTDGCLGTDSQPNVTRVRPFGRVWPGGKVVFEGQGLDPARFQAVVGSGPQRIVLIPGASTPSRIEMLVPVKPEGGPFTPATGAPLSVANSGTAGCKVLNPAFIIADAFTVKLTGSGFSTGYFWIRSQMDLNGAIEGVRSLTILKRAESEDPLSACDWVELAPSARTITLSDNNINKITFGFVRDHRIQPTPQSVQCKLSFRAAIQDPSTNTTENVVIVVPMTIRNPRTITVDTKNVLGSFRGDEPLNALLAGPAQIGAALGVASGQVSHAIGDIVSGKKTPPPNTGFDLGPMGDCGLLFLGDPRTSDVGVAVKNNDWVLSVKSGAVFNVCKYRSKPVSAQLGVAYGPLMKWEVTNQGDPKNCYAYVPSNAIGISHTLDSMEVTLGCEFGPLGDNRVTARAQSIDLLVPFEFMPPVFSFEAP